jgi:predicted MPP superfamily phosphohydrolase
MIKRVCLRLAAFSLLILLCLPAQAEQTSGSWNIRSVAKLFSDELQVVRYAVHTEDAFPSIRIAHVSDLHSCEYGEDQCELLEAIDRENPDLVVLTGDIFDGSLPMEPAAAFLRGIQGKYPCYFVTGNNEYENGGDAFTERMAVLQEYGIIRLSGGMEVIRIKDASVNICGVDDPYAWEDSDDPLESRETHYKEQVTHAAALAQNGNYTILLAHRPELFDFYSQFGFDLVLSGHVHGGQWRIPGLLNGLYAPGQGLFPAYTGGRYEKNGSVMIVSRGLARETTNIPRVNNRPELVIIDLGK